MSSDDDAEKGKKERSPNFPFIPLNKAVERTKTMFQQHRTQPARVASLAVSWGYAPKSSGLSQTVAALKQYGLVSDTGSGEDRKISLTDLGRRIVQDERPGAREAALKEAARRPRLIQEYLSQWLPERPSDAHCISELQLDRGFGEPAAKLFLHVFDDTVAYANLKNDDSLSSSLENTTSQDKPTMEKAETQGASPPLGGRAFDAFFNSINALGPKPFAQRLKIELTAQSLGVTAVLLNTAEVDTLIKMLEANKALLPEPDLDIKLELEQ